MIHRYFWIDLIKTGFLWRSITGDVYSLLDLAALGELGSDNLFQIALFNHSRIAGTLGIQVDGWFVRGAEVVHEPLISTEAFIFGRRGTDINGIRHQKPIRE